MRHFITSLVCLAVGIGIGWYFGYTRPSLQAMHITQELEKETGMSIAEMTKAVPDSLAAIQRDDESVATVSLRGIEILDRGDIPAAKKYLAYWIGSYYRVYHTRGDTNLIARIESAATTNTEIAAELAKKIQ
jgi:4-hydroxyphenylpyruvate dioxygenase-like putative hemolysin